MESLLEKYLRDYVYRSSALMSRDPALLEARYRQKLVEEELVQPVATRIASLCPDLKGARVLEIGSGAGGLSVALALLGARVDGIEPEEAGVEASRARARRYPHIQADFHQGCAERLPFKDATFDLVVSNMVLEHVHDLREAVREMYRVLKVGGKTYHEIPNYLFPREEHYRIFWPPLIPKELGKIYARVRGKNPSFLDHLTYTTPSLIFKTFLQVGFRNLRNLYVEELKAKFQDPSMLTTGWVRGLWKVFKAFRVNNTVGFLILALRMYPVVRLAGEKLNPKGPGSRHLPSEQNEHP